MYCVSEEIVRFLLFGSLVISLKFEIIWEHVGGYGGIDFGG